ncbi:MAG: hypothetical protein ACREF4_05980, partial [Gammaproteobacteria bacterium]
DLDRVTEELRRDYFAGLMQSYLTCVFMNSEYVQHGSGKAKEKKRAEYADRVLRAYCWAAEGRAEDEARGLRCAYSGDAATHLVHRSQIPMLTGAEVLNFFPAGRGALPVAGPYLTAIQTVPMGGRRAEGRLLIAHSDEPSLMIAFAEKYVKDNRRLLDLARQGKLPAKTGPDPLLEREHGAKGESGEGGEPGAKYPDAKGPMSLVAADLLDLSGERLAASSEASVVVYVMSNSGQGPSLAIHPIPSNLVRFLHRVNQVETAATWRVLVARAWRDPAGKEDEAPPKAGLTAKSARPTTKPRAKSKAETDRKASVPGGPGRSRNNVLDDLFPIFDAGFTDIRAARRFARRHLLRDLRWSDYGSAPSRASEIDPALIDWNLTSLFLVEVMAMDAKRTERIKDFADRLADHVTESRDARLFRDVVFGRRAWEVRNALTKAQRDKAREHGQLLFGLQEYLDVFDADDAVGLADWSLTRDLISIRLVETLHQRGFFGERPDWLKTGSPEEEPVAG